MKKTLNRSKSKNLLKQSTMLIKDLDIKVP